MTINKTSAMQAARGQVRGSDTVDGYLYRDPIERVQGLVGAIFILFSVLWLPAIFLLDSGLR